MHHSHIIVGAGLTGLVLAQKLKAKGHSPLILEKSRGLGGRIATRRLEGMGFDHGLSFLPHSRECLDLIKEYSLNSLMKVTSQGIILEGGMNLLAKSLSKDLQIMKEQRLEKITPLGEGWELVTDQQQKFTTGKLIITAPLPQAIELLNSNHIESSYSPQLKEISYTKALIGLFILNKDHPAIPESHNVLIMKDRGMHPLGIVIKGSDEFSSIYFDTPEAEVLKHLLLIKEELLKTKLEFSHQELKKWRYASPLRNFNQAFIQYSPNLFLAGDSFSHGGVRGSISSALALGEAL